MTLGYTATDAEAYERLMRRWSGRLAEELICFAGLAAGDRVLDLGCGTGSMALALAAHPEPAEIVGIDIAAPYVAYAKTRSADPRLDFRAGDGVALNLPAVSFDRSFSLLALNFMSDPEKALCGMRRVTRQGGVVAAAVWDFAGGLVYQRIFWDTAAALDPDAEQARSRHFSGLCDVRPASLTVRMDYAEWSDYWEPIANAQGPVGDYVKGLPPDRLGSIAAAVRRAYLTGQPDGQQLMTATAWIARGVVP